LFSTCPVGEFLTDADEWGQSSNMVKSKFFQVEEIAKAWRSKGITSFGVEEEPGCLYECVGPN
jgi:hypothetical protein